MLHFGHMNPENNDQEITLKETFIAPLCKVTPVSKYLAMGIFIIMPFVGGLIGYQLATERMIEMQSMVATPLSEFSEEEIIELHKIKAEKELESKREQLQNAITQKMRGSATSTVIFSDSGGVPCQINIPAHLYIYGDLFGDFTLAEHTRSCFGDNIVDSFNFTGNTVVQGVIVTDVMDGPFLVISDKQYLKKLPNLDNGILEVDLTKEYYAYQKLYSPELKDLFTQAANNSNEVYKVEVEISGLAFTLGLPKGGFRVNTTVVGEPKIIENTDIVPE